MVGKTSFIDRYINEKFDDQIITIGVDFFTKTIKYKSYTIKLQFWDTGGQERFAPLVSNYYNKVDAIIIMFDLTNYINLKKLNYWLSESKDKKTDNVITILVGNKIDICNPDNFNSLYHDIKEFTDENKLNFFATSAKTGENINNIFEYIIDKYIQNNNINIDNNNKSEIGTKSKKYCMRC